MYTYLILVAFFFLVSAIIYRKKIRQNQFKIIGIVLLGTFIGSIIVNGILGSKIPFTSVIKKEKNLNLQTSIIIDSVNNILDTIKFKSYIQYNFRIKKGKIKDNYLTISRNFLEENFYPEKPQTLKIEYLSKKDTISFVKIIHDKRVIDKKWVSSVALPKKNKQYIVYIPNDSIHNVLLSYINKNFQPDKKAE